MKKPIPRVSGSIHWFCRKSYSSLPDRIHEALAKPGELTTKATHVRNIYLLPASQNLPSLVLKEFKTTRPMDLLRALLLGTPARREWRALELLRTAGIAAPEGLAWGVRYFLIFPYRSYLATCAMEECSTLEEILLQERSTTWSRKDLAAGMGRLVREMHDLGLFHGDLHAANILVDRQGRPHVLDLHGARMQKKLPFKMRARDLVSLAGSFLIHGFRTDRLRFFRSYAEGLSCIWDFKKSARQLEEAAHNRLYLFLKKFDLRPLRPGRLFQAVQIHELSGMAERSERAWKLARFLGPYPNEVLEEKGHPIHITKTTTVYTLKMEDGLFAIKCYQKPGLKERMKRILKGSRAKQSWLNYHKLIFRKIDVTHPVLYLEEPLHVPTGRSFIITEASAGYSTLDRFVRKASRPDFLKILSQLSRILARMHSLFLSNRDLKAQNILISPSLRIYIIDPEGIEYMKDPSLYLMSRDLMRLNASFGLKSRVSRTDRLRFLKTYMARMRLPSTMLRDLWRETLFLTWDKWNRWERKGPKNKSP